MSCTQFSGRKVVLLTGSETEVMKSLSNLLITGSYAISCILVTFFLPVLMNVPGTVALALGMNLFLLCGLVHGRIDSARYERGMNRRLIGLVRGQKALLQDVEAAKRESGQLAEMFDALDLKSHKEIVNEMRVLEGLLQRMAEKRGEVTVNGAAAPAAPHAPTHGARLVNGKMEISLLELNEALEENRIDLYLQPIVSLPQRKVRSYECYSRLRNDSGALIEPAQYIGVAEAAGIVSTIDNFLLLRWVQLIRRLHNRNRGVVIFCNISAHSLRDQGFFPQFVEFMEQNVDLAGSMIFEFSQSTVEENTALEWRQLARLSRQGYRFSMDNLTHLDIDLEELSRRHFAHIKVPAATLLTGMKQARSRFLSSDIKLAMRRFGIDLIAEKIEEEATVVGLLEYELDFGQGYLFGEPRRSRGPDELQSAPQSTARPAMVNQFT
ncbi:MAG: EAL domain-containing protein [Alphaproteobacteria bacterium]|nr:EAL domain-containing protein [Alphaproteobacteria bacterium]